MRKETPHLSILPVPNVSFPHPTPHTKSPQVMRSNCVVVMAKRKQPETVSPKNKRVRHAPLPPGEDRSHSAVASACGTSPHGTEATEEADESKDDSGNFGS
jgi:hypothetical protein